MHETIFRKNQIKDYIWNSERLHSIIAQKIDEKILMMVEAFNFREQFDKKRLIHLLFSIMYFVRRILGDEKIVFSKDFTTI
jgi:hypothetical protein